MSALTNALPWVAAILVVAVALILLRRPLGLLGGLIIRSIGWLGALFAFSQVGGLIGVTLGVNPANALVLGALGAPGLGLLLLLNWTLAL